MADLIREPRDFNPETADWQQLLQKLTVTTGGLMLIDFTEKNTTAVPQIVAGSRFEVNGSFYRVEGNNEDITGFTSVTNNAFAYVYAVPITNGTAAAFQFNSAVPVWDVIRGGHYHPTENWRCLMSVYRNNANCRCKSLIDQRLIYPAPAGNGVSLSILNNAIDIEAGWYRVIISGGNGGDGGQGGTSGNTIIEIQRTGTISTSTALGVAGRAGSFGGVMNREEFTLWLERGRLMLRRGRRGADGMAGGDGTHGSDDSTNNRLTGGDGGRGGDGSDGEPSILFHNGKPIITAAGGRGGRGGAGGINVSANRYATVGIIVRKAAPGFNGIDGPGFTNLTSGNISVFVL